MSTKVTVRHSVSEHVARIENALSRAREAFFEVFVVIKEARDDLGEDTFQKAIARQLSISEATVTKYLKIADCAALLARQHSLPPTVNTLYELTQIHSALLIAHGPQRGEDEFKKVLDDVDARTEASQLVNVLKQVKHRAAAVSKKRKEEKVLALSDSKAADEKNNGAQHIVSLPALLQAKSVYRTIFISPPDEVLQWAGSGVFVDDIADKFHLAELRAPSQSETVQGFVYYAAHRIDAGLKLLTAAGFNFRDVFTPSAGANGFELLRDQKVLLRGERGSPMRPTLSGEVEGTDTGAVSIARALGLEPRLYVFASQAIEGWTCAAPDQRQTL